jgi:guanylate kinase
LDVKGLIEFKKHFKENIMSFFIDVNEPTRKQRCIGRKDFDETEWARRWLDDEENFTDEVINKEVDYIVENYDFDKCVSEILDKIERMF